MAEVLQERREGRVARRAGEERGERARPIMDVPEIAFTSAAGASIIASLALFLARKRDTANFIGQWAPMILLAGVFFELIRPTKR